MMHEVKSLVRTRGATCLNVTIESAGDRATKRSETGLRAPTSRRLALPFLIASLSPPPPLSPRSGLPLWNTRDIDLEMHRDGEHVSSI